MDRLSEALVERCNDLCDAVKMIRHFVVDDNGYNDLPVALLARALVDIDHVANQLDGLADALATLRTAPEGCRACGLAVVPIVPAEDPIDI
jgi:hypothetical protein